MNNRALSSRFASNMHVLVFILLVTLLVLLGSDPAEAFQEHGAREGMYIHLLGHVCFAISMAGLWYGIRQSRLGQIQSWRYMAAGALFLVLWNVMTFSGHVLSHFVLNKTSDNLHNGITMVWKLSKLDNIVCLTAMLCFYAGLRKMLNAGGIKET